MNKRQQNTTNINDHSEHIFAGFDRQIIEASPSGMVLVDAQDSKMPIVYINTAFENMTGYSRDEVVGLNCRFLQRGDRNQPDLDILRKAIAKKQTCTVTLRNYRKDGTLFWNELRVSPIFGADGQLTHFVGVQNDVTELRESEQRYRALFDDSLNLIYLHDFEGNFLDANEAALEFMGYTREEIASLNFTSIVVPEDLPEVFAYLQQIQGDNQTTTPLVTRLKKRNGEIVFVEAMLSIIHRDSDAAIVQGVARDITKLKHARDSLKAVLDSSLNGIMAFDSVRDESGQIMDFRWTQVNYRAEQMVGRSQAELLDKYLLVEMPGNREAGLFDLYVNVVETGQPLDHEHYYEHEGIEIWFHTTAVKLDDGFVVTFADITERKQMEEELSDNAHRLRWLIQNMPILIDAFDPEEHIIVWNRKCEQVTGYTADEIVGNPRSIEMLYPDPDYRQYVISDALRLGDELHNREYILTCRDGSQRTIHWSHIPAPYSVTGDIKWAIGIDVTEQHRAERALRASEHKYRTLSENIPDNIQRLDRNGTHLYVNAYYAAALALPVDQIIGKTNEELGMPNQMIEFFKDMRERVYTTKQAIEFDFSFPVAGEMRYFFARMIPEFDPEGNVVSLLSVSSDITDRNRAQQREFELKLEQERRMLLTTFIQNAAHEFRTPLAKINSSAYLMSRYVEADQRTEKAAQIEKQIQFIARLIDMLLLTVQLENSEMPAMVSVNLPAIIHDVLQEVRKQCSVSHDLRWDIPSDLPEIMGKTDDLFEAFKQIIENACRFTPEGDTITLSAQAEGGNVWVEVQDTGPGIPEKDLPYIFETFWRQDKAHSTPGFGLGLSLAQKIIEQHGGKISVESVESEGSKFRVVLPFLNEP